MVVVLCAVEKSVFFNFWWCNACIDCPAALTVQLRYWGKRPAQRLRIW
jgi:hypothetical protein